MARTVTTAEEVAQVRNGMTVWAQGHWRTSFKRLGGTRAVAVDVRVISATNRDLEKRAENGEFRSVLGLLSGTR